MLDDRNYPWLASIVDPTGLCGHINNVLQLIQPTYRNASRAHAAVSIDAFCFFFSRRHGRQLVCRLYTHSELVSFRVSTHACPGTSPQVHLNGYMGVQVSRRTRMQIGSQLIQGRNNDNPPCSLPTNERIFIGLYLTRGISQHFGKIR